MLSMDVRADTTPDAVIGYEQRLSADFGWAMSEGDRHFSEDSGVFRALRKITRRLDALNIPYTVVGGMALFRHGLRRFTEDVDLLVTRENLHRIHEHLAGLGYVPVHKNSRNLRDAELGVRIEFLTTGDFPGDGKPKPVAFPNPTEVSIDHEGIQFIRLEKLIELKLASGMTSPGRLRDLADVMEIVRAMKLPREFGSRLDPYVQPKFDELWAQAHGSDALPENL